MRYAMLTLLFCIVVVVIQGCSQTTNTTAQVTQLATTSLVTPQTGSQVTRQASLTKPVMPPSLTPANHDEMRFVQQCYLFSDSDTPSDTITEGSLILGNRDNYKLYLNNLANHQRDELNGAVWRQVFVSPNNNKFSYVFRDVDNNYSIIAYQNLGKERQSIILNKTIFGEFPIFSGWINNEVVGFELFADQPISLITLNLSTGDQQILYPDYPDINDKDSWEWGYWGRTLYSPDLGYVVYPAISAMTPHEYIVWDILQQNEVNSLETGHTIDTPQWASNGRWLAVAKEDFVLLEINGTKRQLSYLQDSFPDFDTSINAWSWSPNSLQIAFWLALSREGTFVEERLFLLDLPSETITDTCINGDQIQVTSGSYNGSPSPVWSPDGKALLVENRPIKNGSLLLLLDLVEGIAYQIGENNIPLGWINTLQ